MKTTSSLPPGTNSNLEKRIEELLFNTSFKGDLNFKNSKLKDFRDQLLELASLHKINAQNENSLIKNITESSTISHKTLRVHWDSQMHGPFSFVCHTEPSDPDPWVIFEFSEIIKKGDSVHAYNRCGTLEVSSQIEDCTFWFSYDQKTWHELGIELNKDQIFNSAPISLIAPIDSRFLRIAKRKDESEVRSTVIHINKITLASNKDAINNSTIKHIINDKGFERTQDGQIMEYKGRKINGTDFVHPKKISTTINFSDEVDFASAVLIKENLNFSNFIIQLCNAVCFCEENGIDAIYIMDDKRSRQLIPSATKFTSSKKITFIISNEEPSAFILFSGIFFYTRAIKNSRQRILRGIEYFESITEFRCLPKAHSTHQHKNFNANENILTVHIRSSDIFEEKNPHPGYGQPPLSYYKWCIKDHNPSKVKLVYQNLSNPIIDPLISWLESESIEYEIQTSSNLREDVQALIDGDSFVIGNGTFMLGVLALAENVNRIYIFGDATVKSFSSELPSIIPTIVKIKDSDNFYTESILKNNWKNNDKQRKLMTNYPIENIIRY